MQALLVGCYFLLVRRPPGQDQQALTAGLKGGSRESLAAASEMQR